MHPQQQAPPPQGFVVGAGMPPPQGTPPPNGGVIDVDAAVAESRAQAEAAAAAAKRAGEQMAWEDVWKVFNPDFRTPFASVEDAVSRLLPYHVFWDEDEDDGLHELEEETNSQEMERFLAHFEKQVLSFNVMTRQRAEGFNRGEERLKLEMALLEDERQQMEHVRATIAQRQRELQQQAASARMALAPAQDPTVAWPQAQPSTTPAWQQALAAAATAAAARAGQGSSGGQQAMVPALMMQQLPPPPPQQQQQQQQEMTMTPGAWQALAAATASRDEGFPGGQAALIQAVMMQQIQQQQQQQQLLEMMAGAAARGDVSLGGQQALTPAMMMQMLHQQQQEMMAAGTWQMGVRQGYVTLRGDGSSSSQAGPALQQQAAGQGQAAAMALPWRSSAERSEQQ